MAVVIEKEKCILCGLCAEQCPEDILVKEEGEIKVRYPEECCWCGACQIDCPVGAIHVRFTGSVGPVFVMKGRGENRRETI